ncbi:MAG TPA: ABC transporter permease [Bryobacteraceae bacterium]|jgi:predicted permease
MKFLRRIRYLIGQRRMERELAEEIEFHRQMSGDPREMGNVTRAREDARAVWIWPWLQSIWQDAAYAIRNLRRQPGFTLVALATLGLAIGVNASFFTFYNAVAIRPWPVRDPARVVKIASFDPRPGQPGVAGVGAAESRYLAAHTRAFAGLAFIDTELVHFGFEAFGKASYAQFVNDDYFRLLGVEMQLGRGFVPDENRIESPEAVAVLGFQLWRDRFGSDPEIVGKRVHIEQMPVTIVGVAPEDFTGTTEGGFRPDVYLPLPALLSLFPNASWPRDLLTKANYCCSFMLGRLAPGISREQAAAELAVLDRQFKSQFGGRGRGFILSSSAMLDDPGHKGQATVALALMFAGGMLIVLLACANVGNFLVARTEARRKEIEIRRAIGAGRARIIRQLMTESMLLALGAAAIGLGIAYWLPLFALAQTGNVPGIRMTPDGTVLIYAIGMAAFTCIAFGLAPALHGTRANSRSRLALRSILLAAQVALGVILLIGAGLMLRGVADLRLRDVGFAIDGVSVASFELPSHYDSARVQTFYRRLTSDLDGAQRFAFTLREPLSNNFAQSDFLPSGQPVDARAFVDFQEVTARYFDLLRIPIVAGRNFEAADAARPVVLVNESLARRFWGDRLPLGKTIVSRGVTREIVGVVKDVDTGNLDRMEPIFYLPFSGRGVPKVLLPSLDPAAAEALRASLLRIEPRARMQAAPLRDNLDRWLRGPRLGAELAGGLGLFALALASIGMAGVFAYAVQHRTKEIGIRMALGAQPAQVVGLVLGGSARAVAIGLAAGFAIALPASRLLRSELHGISPVDPVAYLAAALILAAAAIAASYAPARRATRIDPATALRHD